MSISSLPREESLLRIGKLQQTLAEHQIDAMLLCSNVNLLYVTGLIFDGYLYLPQKGEAVAFSRRPKGLSLSAMEAVDIGKPEQIPDLLTQRGMALPQTVWVDEDDISAGEYLRLSRLFPEARWMHRLSLARTARMIKTPYEIEQIHISAEKQKALYETVPSLYREGMTDLDLTARIEYEARKQGHLGLFRTFGFRMEAHMGSVLAGDNAAAPSPYDFALGGQGLHPSLPMSQWGRPLEQGTTVMVDITGNYTGYQSDCSRTFSIGEVPKEAHRAHALSMEIQAACVEESKKGVSCCDLYQMGLEMVQKAGFSDCFMGRSQQAKFFGHGLGIEINEMPVIAPRCDIRLQPGMVLALEPKFVLEGIGAVGTENTYVMTETGLECITLCPSELIAL